MAKGFAGGRGKWALTGVVALLAAFVFWRVQPSAGGDDKNAVGRALPVDEDTRIRAQSIALRYAEAMEAGDCDAVVDLTAWMRERLHNAAVDASAGETPAQVREDLCSTLQERSVEDNRIRPEGVEDRYVFAPGVKFEAVQADRGREDLTSPVQARVWIRVTYPNPSRALCDEHGRAIHSLKVGVNVSPEGYVVKSGVLGNLDVAPDSFRYDWGVGQGG